MMLGRPLESSTCLKTTASCELGARRNALLGFGTFQVDGRDARQVVRTALEVGYRHIDTATGYSNKAEVGAAVRDSGIERREIFITTKCPPRTLGTNERRLRQVCETSEPSTSTYGSSTGRRTVRPGQTRGKPSSKSRTKARPSHRCK